MTRVVSRMPMGPRAVDGSTTRPAWVISTAPSATSRRAAARVGSIRSRQSSPPTDLAAADGQMVVPAGWASSSSTMASPSLSSIGAMRRRRHASEQ